MKIFIATHAFSGKVNIQYAISLAETVDLLHRNGIGTQKFITSSGSLLLIPKGNFYSGLPFSNNGYIKS